MTRQPWICIAIVLAGSIAAPDVRAQNLTCGIKPIPAMGCRIGRCVTGAWEQICDNNPGRPAD
jgi:hypothetical protein